MTLDPQRFAAAAEALVGSPFRLHGRDPATGLDCIGVFAAALRACGHRAELPEGYRLRMASIEHWVPGAEDLGFGAAQGAPLTGDVVLQQLGPVHYHLAIAARSAGWVHAHAGLRRVVRTAILPEGPIIAHWRLAPSI